MLMKILGSEIDARENLKFSFKRYWIFWLVLLVTIFLDYLTTLHFINEYGVHIEANRIVRYLMENIGVTPGLLLGKSLQLVSVLIFVCLHQRLGNLFLLIIILLNIWAVFINML